MWLKADEKLLSLEAGGSKRLFECAQESRHIRFFFSLANENNVQSFRAWQALAADMAGSSLAMLVPRVPMHRRRPRERGEGRESRIRPGKLARPFRTAAMVLQPNAKGKDDRGARPTGLDPLDPD